MKLTTEEIKNIFADHVKEDIEKITIQKGGWSSTTHRIETSSGKVYFFKENHNNHRLELDLTRKLGIMGVPLPEIVGLGGSWMLMKSIGGTPLKDLDVTTQLSVLPSAGRSVALINSLAIEGFGPLTSINKGSHSTYLDFYEPTLRRLPAVRQSAARDYVMSIKKSYLCHGDVSLTHIFVDKKGKFEALIDLDDVLGAAQHYDLAEFDSGNNRNEVLWNAFVEGYSTILPVPPHDSKELLMEEYLILFDSCLWIKENYPKRLDSIVQEEARLKSLEKLIWAE